MNINEFDALFPGWAVYGYYQDASSFHQAAASYLAVSHVLHGQFKQRRFICIFGQVDRRSTENAWKIGHAIRAMMKVLSNTIGPRERIVELDENYLGGKGTQKKLLRACRCRALGCGQC